MLFQVASRERTRRARVRRETGIAGGGRRLRHVATMRAHRNRSDRNGRSSADTAGLLDARRPEAGETET